MNKYLLTTFSARIAAQFRNFEFENPFAWPVMLRWFSFAAVYCLTVGVFYLFLLSDCANALQNVVAKENRLRTEFTDKLGRAAQLPGSRAQREQVALQVEALEKQLPSSTEISSLLLSISRVGRDQKLQQELFRPDAPIFKQHYAIVPVTFRAHGGYHDFARFAAELANLPRIVNLSAMSISATSEGPLMLEATVRAYRHLELDEVPAQAKRAEVGQ